jgi:PAS domain S-box-containing protein
MLQSSEERFRSVAETALEAIICADSEANMTFWNAGAENIFGYAAEEMTGKPLTWILPESERQARLQSIMGEGASDTSAPARIFDMTGFRKDGGEFPMELSRSTWKSDTGETNFAVIVRDVTTRKRAEEALRDSVELYRALLHASPDAVLCFDLEGTIVEASRRSAELYGYDSPAELIGMNALELVAPGESEKADYSTGKVLEEGGVWDIELNLMKRDGTTFIGEVSAASRRDKDGNVSGYMDVVRDVTARKLAGRELQILNNELQGYAHLVSHDLKGPLSSLMVASFALRELLKGELDGQAVREVMELARIIESNVTKSSALIDDLLVLAEASQKPYEVTEVDIGSVVERVIGERAQEIKNKRMKMRRNPDLGRVVASSTHMYQLFSNLIENAIKHNDSRKPEVSVSYAGRGSGGLHRYLVKDNGTGIDPEEIEKIFLPFFSGKTGGTGIGLATVDKIVSLYGGTIRACNDNGACFEFTLKDYA